MAWTNNQMLALINKPEPEDIRLVDLINKPEPEEIYHHGIKGQKWGIRRYQNPDGSLTPEGKRRYSVEREDYTAKRDNTVRKGVEYRISGKGKDKKTVDKLVKAGDMKKADELFKSVGDKAMEEFYNSGDINKAIGILIDGMKDVPFDYILDHETNLVTGEEWVNYMVTTKGKKSTIDTPGVAMYKPGRRVANQHLEQSARDAAQAHQDSMRMAQQAHEDAIRAAEMGRQQAEQAATQAAMQTEQTNQLVLQQQRAQEMVQQQIFQQQMMFMMM